MTLTLESRSALPTGSHLRFLRVFSLVVAVVCFGVFLLELGRAAPLVQRIGVTTCILCCALAAVTPNLACAVLGFLLCTLPYFGNQVTNLAVTAVVASCIVRGYGESHPSRSAADHNSIPRLWIHVGLLLLAVESLLRLVPVFITEFDPTIAVAIVSRGGLHGFLGYLWQNRVVWDLPLIGPCGVVIAVLVYDRFSLLFAPTEDGGAKRGFVLGLLAGVGVAMVVLVAQLLKFSTWFTMNRAAFWELTGRYPATFSDPNAFGVMAGMLVIFFATQKYTRARVPIVALLFVGAVWSGSRTYTVLLVSGAILFNINRMCRASIDDSANGTSSKGRARFRKTRMSKMLLLASGLVALLPVPALNEALQSALPVPGLTRVLQTIHFHHSAEMVANRFLYARLALEVWGVSPYVGVGWGRFIFSQTDAAHALGIALDGWRDNANNFYLQVLAEGGILGSLLTGIAFVLMGRGLSKTYYGLAFGLVMGVALLTGPHLLFDEVRYFTILMAAYWSSTLFALPSSRSSEHRQRAIAPPARGAIAVILVVSTVVAICHPGITMWKKSSSGLYAREFGADGSTSWTADRAVFPWCSPAGDPRIIQLKAIHPDIVTSPVTVTLVIDPQGPTSYSARIQSTQINDSRWHTVELLPGKSDQSETTLRVEMFVDRLWSPAQQSIGVGDKRWLGVMIRWPEEGCLNSRL